MAEEHAGELGAAAVAVAVAGVLAAAPSLGAPLLAPLAVGAVTAWIVWRDVAAFIIPDAAVVALASLGVALRVAAGGGDLDAWGAMALDAGLPGGALWALREIYFRARGQDGLGFGDVKLAAAAGLLVGASGVALALLAASLAGLGVAALRGGMTRNDRLPLGALLAPAVLMVWLAGGQVPAPWP